MLVLSQPAIAHILAVAANKADDEGGIGDALDHVRAGAARKPVLCHTILAIGCWQENMLSAQGDERGVKFFCVSKNSRLKTRGGVGAGHETTIACMQGGSQEKKTLTKF